MLASFFASVLDSAKTRVTFDGSLSATATGSTTVTGTARTGNVPAGNSGELKFVSVNEAAGNLEYSLNGGAFTSLAENTTITIAHGQTLRMRGTGLGVETGVSATLQDVTTGQTVASIAINRGAS